MCTDTHALDYQWLIPKASTCIHSYLSSFVAEYRPCCCPISFSTLTRSEVSESKSSSLPLKQHTQLIKATQPRLGGYNSPFIHDTSVPISKPLKIPVYSPAKIPSTNPSTPTQPNTRPTDRNPYPPQAPEKSYRGGSLAVNYSGQTVRRKHGDVAGSNRHRSNPFAKTRINSPTPTEQRRKASGFRNQLPTQVASW